MFTAVSSLFTAVSSLFTAVSTLFTVVEDKEDTEAVAIDAADKYWKSEHHRFQYSNHIGELLELDPLSYHNMGLAVPGSFVEEQRTMIRFVVVYIVVVDLCCGTGM